MPDVSLEENLHFSCPTVTHKQVPSRLHNHAGNTVWWKHSEMAALYEWAFQTIRPWQWQWGLSRSVTSLRFFFLCLLLCAVLPLSLTQTSAHTSTGRQNIFISPLYAACALTEIAALTPRCELYRGNVYANPTVHAINLFLDRRQTRMSLHEGKKDWNTYPGPSWQSSHYEAVGGSNDPESPVSQGHFLCGIPVCLTLSEVLLICSQVQTTY